MPVNHLSTDTPASNMSSKKIREVNMGLDDSDSGGLDTVTMDDILRNSPAAALLGLTKDEDEDSTEDSSDVPNPRDEEQDTPEEGSTDGDTDGEEQTEGEETEEEGKDDEQDSTEEADLPSEEDIDWEYKIPVTINGKTEHKTLEEIRKGFATDQSLSQKGRELGDERKKLDQERTEKLQDLVTIGSVLHEDMTEQETALSQNYAGLKAKYEEAKKAGDRIQATDLKEQMEEVQESYWTIRNKREDRVKKVVEKIQAQSAEQQQKLIETFSTEIKTVLPEFNDKLAKSIREFALKEGIPAELLNVIYSAPVIKALNEFRKLREASSKGSTKRTAQPIKKVTPAKKATPIAQKVKKAVQAQRSRVLSGQGSEQDGLDFLKRISSVAKKM
jgi:hypothetical protein